MAQHKNWIISLQLEIEQLKAKLEDALKNKHPNTCPLCEGHRLWKSAKTKITDFCPCCKGKGTV